MLLCLSCLLGKKKQQQTSIGLNRAIGTKPVKAFIIGLPVANRKMSRIYVEKRQKGVACPISLAVGPTSEGRGSLRFYHEFNGILLGTRLP